MRAIKLVSAIVTLLLSTLVIGQQTATATFAGGCFWCMEPPCDKLEGVISITSVVDISQHPTLPSPEQSR